MERAHRPVILPFALKWKISLDQLHDVRGGKYFLDSAFRDQSHLCFRLVILLPLPNVASTAKLTKKDSKPSNAIFFV